MSKCKFWKRCPLYREEDVTCNKDGGMYYDWDRPGGCWFEMERKDKLIPKTLSWLLYRRVMNNVKVKDSINVDLNKIGINKKFKFNIIKKDEGLSKQLTAFKFREPLNWKNYYDYVENKDIVLDIGANIGLFSILSCKAKKIICVEPVEECMPILKKNLKDNNMEAIIINKAVGKNVKIEKSEHINLSKVSDNGVLVESETLKKLCDKYNPTLLRMDVEGYEYEILKEGIPACVEKICLEFHTNLLGGFKVIELLKIFQNNNFDIDIMIEDLPLRLYPYYNFLKLTGLIKLVTYKKENLSYNKAMELVFKGRGIKYFLISR